LDATPRADIAEPAIAVVLDANVLYPAALRDTLMRSAERGLYRPRWSALILDELARNLIEDGRSDEARTQRMIADMRRYFPGAEVQVAEELIATMTNAAEDRHVLAAAVSSGAALIVTENLKDFPESALSPHGVEALSPDEFLGQLLNVDPMLMAQVLREQVADLINPPLTVQDVLKQIALQAPRFSERAGEILL
jgi:hypothetical protein